MPYVQEKFKLFDLLFVKSESLDNFIVSFMKDSQLIINDDLLTFIKKICVMFHGNAQVERGFS